MNIFDKDYGPGGNMNGLEMMVILKVMACALLESAMWLLFFGTYNETIGLMDHTYIADLPIIGALFGFIDPDANVSHILSALLALFSVGTPLVLWAECYRQDIFSDPQEWLSHPQNKVYASIALAILAMVIALECVNLYTLIARETSTGGFIQEQQSSEVMAFLAENKGVAIGVSAVIAVINILLALFTTRAMQGLNSEQELSQ